VAVMDFVAREFLGRDEAKALSEPFWSDMRHVWQSAWSSWHNVGEDERARLLETPTARPGALNAFAQSFAREMFRGRESEGIVECEIIPNVFAFYVHEKILLRFNALGPGYLVRAVEANEFKRRYFKQLPIRGIINSANRMTVGYRVNEAKTDLEEIAISLQYGPDLIYYFSIDDAQSMQLPSGSQAPTPKPPVASNQIRHGRPR